MGWLWSSSPSGDGANTSENQGQTDGRGQSGITLTAEQRQRIFGRPAAIQESDQSRDADADKELEAFLNSLSASDDPKTSSNTTKSPKTALHPQPEERTDHDRILPDGTLNISPAAIYPRTMSCRQAFDQAFYCQSLGGKFNDIYRYGALQSCSEQWGAFWFCMRTKSLSEKERGRQIADYYAAREERKRKEFGSSEDVWEIRTKAVEKAFGKDPDAEDEGVGAAIKK